MARAYRGAFAWNDDLVAELRRLRTVECLSLENCAAEIGVDKKIVMVKARELGINGRLPVPSRADQ